MSNVIPTEAVIEEVREERWRQIEEERMLPKGDDEHVNGELGDAAACYAASDELRSILDACPVPVWPFHPIWDKRHSHPRRRQLVIAAALIVAEIERLDRAAAPAPGDAEGEG